MLFPYTYVPHQMEKMQEFINFIFYEVWCKAPIGVEFTLELFDTKPDLKEVLSSFGFAKNAPDRGKQFYKEIKAIYALFEPLNAEQINQFTRWYEANNEIERVCNNDPSTQLARYADIALNHADLADKLGTFFKNLYSQSLLKLADLKAKIGDINDHYNNAFLKSNSTGKCPFCGIDDIKGKNHSYREAYDHYLPKKLYPFNSINFHNLAPACHECNSTYKLSKDPAQNHLGRRKAFYPYAIATQSIEVKVDLLQSDIAKLSPTDINLTFGPTVVNEQIETWKDVYGIEERYKAKLCGESDGKYWLTQVLDEWKEDGREPLQFLSALTRQTQNKPYAECNFLKKPFLDACQTNGLFDALPPAPL
ncbi:HNH endonuclease [Marinomonas shanghaiensis]|uniref:HNH endonuclease n=1 Tax=Marinomonas shanghaiensis TaxID=2202418 RepID=UPI003A933F1F